ncbi:MAG: pyridoxamine 5'-phosphate oxidase family protein [Deltaproteobacteria bacterium]|nr:pyridoxamine 5'-phosphate oxidase family protein [Deltaproteobacteria bacterium]
MDRIITAFTDEVHPAYGQIATVDADGHPHVRTVHWRYVTSRNAIGCVCYSDSEKWRHLQLRQVYEGCYFDQTQQMQFRWEGKVELIDGRSAEDQALLSALWEQLRPEVRASYWAQHLHGAPTQPLGAAVNLNERCPMCVAILTIPDRWDIYDINPTNFRQGNRTICTRAGTQWCAEIVSLFFRRG